ncbi:jmjC domain-containing protein 8-like [Watersipora subatra]|uniref:jmjC domain-containing protein 8-like n=1 Tax=Watersipora subatra TaxID=2589382 RepID=UPI00355BE950
MQTTPFLASPFTFLFLLLMLAHCASQNEWYIDQLAEQGPCNIEVRDSASLSQREFIDVYAYTKPVIISYNDDWNKVFQSECSKENMLKKYGEKIIRLSSANTHSYRKRDVTLQYYVEELLKPQDLDTLGNETFYWFGDNNHTEWKELFDLYKKPHLSLPGKEGMYSFGMAGAGTGVPFHWHGPGFGEVVYGRKRWFLFPPDKMPYFNPDRTTLYWLINDYQEIHPAELPLECTLKPGQVIYFPNRWWHATLNLDTSIFISTFLG